MIIIGVIFSFFLGPDERLRVFECPFAVWSVISEDFEVCHPSCVVKYQEQAKWYICISSQTQIYSL